MPFRILFALLLIPGLLRAADAPPKLVVPSSHGAEIITVITSPDGKWTVSGTATREIKLWDTQAGKEMGTTISGKSSREALVGLYARNNKEFYAVSTRSVQIYQIPSLRLVTTIDCARDVFTANVSADGEALFLGGAENKKQYVMALRRGRFPVRQLWERSIQIDTGIHHGGWHLSPVLTSDGKFAVYPDTGAFHLVDLETQQVVRTLQASAPDGKSQSYYVGWTPDDQLAHYTRSSTTQTTSVSFYDPVSGLPSGNHTLPEGMWLRPGGAKGTPAVFGNSQQVLFVTKTAVDGPYKSPGRVTAGAFSREGKLYVGALNEEDVEKTQTNQLRGFDFAKGSFSDRWSATNLVAKIFKLSPQGNAILIGDRSRLAKLIRFENGAVKVLSITHRVDFDAEFTADGETLIVNNGSHERTQELLDTRSGRVVRKATLPFTSNARSANGRLLLSPSGKYVADFRVYGSHVEIQEVGTGRVHRNLPIGYYSYDEPSLPCAFSPDESSFVYFVYEKEGRKLRCYDLAAGTVRWTRDLNAVVGGIFFSPDGSTVHVTSAERFPTFQFLDPKTGSDLKEAVRLKTDVSGASRPAISPAATHIAYPCGSDVLAFEIATGQLKGKLTQSAQNALHAGYSSENQLFALSLDGSIRLWDLNRQQLLGTMTFSKEGDDWAFVHPSGRFEATAASQEQMYFVQGAKRAPLSAYFEAFYTPGLIGDVLSGASIQAPAVELQDLIEPPTVRLRLVNSTRNLTVEDAPEEVSTETVTLSLVADSADSPISEIRLFHNGKRIEAKTRNLVVEDDEGAEEPKPLSAGAKQENITVVLLPGENQFRAIALNAQRTESEPAELAVEYTPNKESAAVAGRTGGGLQLHLLIVGINTYRNPKYNLNYAVPDATAVQQTLEKSSGKIFSKVNVTTLFDQKATRAAVRDAFKAIAAASGPRDVFVFYYAGHGVMTAEPKPEFFLVPYDVTQLYGADETMREKAVSSADLLAFSQEISAQKQLFLLDACQSAGALQSVAQRGAAEEKAVAQLARASGTHWITASGSEQFATEFEKLGHGTFTYALLEALGGKADNGDGRITVNELKAFLETQVPELTKLHKGTPQYPASYGFGQDFPVVVVK